MSTLIYLYWIFLLNLKVGDVYPMLETHSSSRLLQDQCNHPPFCVMSPKCWKDLGSPTLVSSGGSYHLGIPILVY